MKNTVQQQSSSQEPGLGVSLKISYLQTLIL